MESSRSAQASGPEEVARSRVGRAGVLSDPRNESQPENRGTFQEVSGRPGTGSDLPGPGKAEDDGPVAKISRNAPCRRRRNLRLTPPPDCSKLLGSAEGKF